MRVPNGFAAWQRLTTQGELVQGQAAVIFHKLLEVAPHRLARLWRAQDTEFLASLFWMEGRHWFPCLVRSRLPTI